MIKFQKIIWKAAQKGASIAVFLKDWDILVGTPVFCIGENYNDFDLPNGQTIFIKSITEMTYA